MTIRIRGKVARQVSTIFVVAHKVALLAGVALLSWPAFILADSAYAQWSGERQLAMAVRTKEAVVTRNPNPQRSKPEKSRGTPLGQVEIPRLNLSYVLLEGTDDRTLDRSIGHVEGTGLIGETGNVSIAGHRNTHFRKLEWIRRGDEIVLKSAVGQFRYRVEWMRLFKPHDVQVLDASHGPAVTLITCFPFEYVGSAPLRMIVRALPDEETKALLQPSGVSAAENEKVSNKPVDE